MKITVQFTILQPQHCTLNPLSTCTNKRECGLHKDERGASRLISRLDIENRVEINVSPKINKTKKTMNNSACGIASDH
jgi:hypothetical protein